MRSRNPSGFTIIELLVVIAIIAILAAILFPVFSRVRESARQTTCIANMHQIFVAVGQYKEDYNSYPCMLLGPAERPDGYLWVEGNSVPPVPAGRIKYGGYLYPAYIKNIEAFHCPDNPDTDQQKVTVACYPTSSALNQYYTQKYGHDWPPVNGACIKLKPSPSDTNAGSSGLMFYAYDSYDISSNLQTDGQRMIVRGGPGYQLVYAKKWTLDTSTGRGDTANQLMYPNAPPDKTVLTLCNYHVTTGHADKCPVMLATGTTKPLDYKQVAEKGWKIMGEQ